MTIARRQVMWPLLMIIVGGIWLLMVAGALPEAVGDILLRSWPALLFLLGFDVLFGRRRFRFLGRSIDLNVVGILLTAVMLGVMIAVAYQHQANTLRVDHFQQLVQELEPEVEQIRIAIHVQRTSVDISTLPDDSQEIRTEFSGSRESDVVMEWAVEGDTGHLTIDETYRHAIPKLEDIGRGTLTIQLPAGASVEQLVINGDRGDLKADLDQLRVQQIDVAVGRGDVWLALPTLDVMQGRVKSGDGQLELLVPADMALDVKLEPGSGIPRYHYDSFRYDELRTGELKRKNVVAFQYVLDVWLKDAADLIVTDLK